MKNLYININNEQIQSSDELEVLMHDLDSDFFFYLGAKIAKDYKVENEIALITDFNTPENEEEYKQIMSQWNEIKTILFNEKCEGKFKFILPKKYFHWLKFHPQYVSIYDRNFSYGNSSVIPVNLEELYEESVGELQCKILRKLKRNDLYLEVNKIIFNDNAITRKSSIFEFVKKEYKTIPILLLKEWIEQKRLEEERLGEQLEKERLIGKIVESLRVKLPRLKKEKLEKRFEQEIKSCDLFPITNYNIVLGKTSLLDIPDDNDYIIRSKENISHYLQGGLCLDKIVFSVDKKSMIINKCEISRGNHLTKIPDIWLNKFGWSFNLNHGEWVKILRSNGFIVYEIGYSWADSSEGVHILAQSPCLTYRVQIQFCRTTTIKIDCMSNTIPQRDILNSLKIYDGKFNCPICQGELHTLFDYKSLHYMNCERCDTIWWRESLLICPNCLEICFLSSKKTGKICPRCGTQC